MPDTSETNSVDSAFEKLRECDHYLEELGAVEAKVRRLREVVEDQALTIGVLKDELALAAAKPGATP